MELATHQGFLEAESEQTLARYAKEIATRKPALGVSTLETNVGVRTDRQLRRW